ncbi:MAG: elongation factor P maturation arginine rhamnosyltransferase EarP [Proteobacteria bacterium]|nr:elongation factor P maturation arginine rhamnosyltransferase EarP [Pseudomonadota bacterium]
MKVWHIFSRAIDNFGDVAISLRLSYQLSTQDHCAVILYTEFNKTLQRFFPNLDITSNVFVSELIEVRNIDYVFDDIGIPTYIINVFNIGIPQNYLKKITQQTKYIIYEYLSAEQWVNNFHLKPSINANKKLDQIFFFPGFTENTGGLLIEEVLPRKTGNNLNFFIDKNTFKGLNFSMYAYPNTNLDGFLTIIDDLSLNAKIYISEVMLQYQNISLDRGKQVIVYPFIAFDGYDQLLSVCDINFVRGEDSLVRAIISGKPFIWQPYIQESETHLVKLDAFVEFYFSELKKPLFKIIQSIFNQWAGGRLSSDSLIAFVKNIDEFNQYYHNRSKSLRAQKTAVNNLMEYC